MGIAVEFEVAPVWTRAREGNSTGPVRQQVQGPQSRRAFGVGESRQAYG
jgi:hypothetical protein